MLETKDTPIEEPKFTTSIPKLKKISAKLVVVTQVVHQVLREQPTSMNFGYSRPLTTDNYPFIIPRVKLNQEWKQIDSSWIEKDKCSTLIISNNEGRNPTKIPSPEEIDNITRRVVEIGFLTTYLAPTIEEIQRTVKEEKSLNTWEKMANKKIEQPEPISLITPLLFIPPGEKHPFSFIDLSLVFFRSREGEINCTFSFFPN